MAKKILADLAIRMTAQTAALKKGMDDAKQRMKSAQNQSAKMGKTMSTAFQNASNQIDKFVPGFSRMSSGIINATKGVGKFTGSLKIMKMALISTGIGAIVVALGALISNLKNTKKGADVMNRALGGIKAVIDTVMHRINLMGEAILLLKQGKFKEAADKVREAFSKVGDEIRNNYQAGQKLAERENKLKKEQIAFIEKEAAMRHEIARLVEISSDKTLDTQKRQEATAAAIVMQNKLSSEKVRLAAEEAAILQEKNALGDNTYEDDRAEAEARAAIVDLRKEELDKVRELKNRMEEIQGTMDREAASAEKLKENIAKLGTFEPAEAEDLTKLFEDFGKDAESALSGFAVEATDTAEQEFQTFSDKIAEQVEATKSRIAELNGMLSGAMADMIGGIAEAVGSGNLSDVFKTVVNAIAGFAQTLGKMLIAQGIAIEAFKKSLQSLNPVVAVVAGIGLIAAGAALKAFMSKGIPALAEGGIAYGDTIARVGEYSGASSNPEVIAPLNKLQSIMGGGSSGGEKLVAVVTGDQLNFVLEEYKRKQGNTF